MRRAGQLRNVVGVVAISVVVLVTVTAFAMAARTIPPATDSIYYDAPNDGHRAPTFSIKNYATKVEIDIKPGSFPSAINLGKKGVVPVAVLTTEDFDASTVIAETVIFAGATPVHWAMEDVDGDGDVDLVLHYDAQELNLKGDETVARVDGWYLNSAGVKKAFWGENEVKLILKDKSK